MKPIERRLAHLEAKTNPAENDVHFCMAEDGETSEAAVARRWPQGKPAGKILVIQFGKSDEDA